MGLHKNTLNHPIRIYTPTGVVTLAPGQVKGLSDSISSFPAGVVEVKKAKAKAAPKAKAPSKPKKVSSPKVTENE
jgi:hypothetical protein